MSTHAMIGARVDGKLMAAYVHMDGGFDNLGRTLDLHCTTNEGVRALIGNGRYSALGHSLQSSVRDVVDDESFPLVLREQEGPDSESFFDSAFRYGADIQYAYFWDGHMWLAMSYDDERVSYVRERFSQSDEEFVRYHHEQESRWKAIAEDPLDEIVGKHARMFARNHSANAGVMWQRICERRG